MIRPEQIPDEVVQEAAAAIAKNNDGTARFAGLYLTDARAAIAAALAAWPGAHVHEWQRPWLGGMSGTDIILPLPQEKSDD